jgi:hypothetical protein
MKGMIKGGLCLALGWLTSQAGAQEVLWKASAPNDAVRAAVAPAWDGQATGIRPVSLTAPVPLGAFDPIGAPAPKVRAQSAAEPPLPVPGNKDASQLLMPPRALPPGGGDFTGPSPQPYSIMTLPSNSAWDVVGVPQPDSHPVFSSGGGDCGCSMPSCDSCGSCCAPSSNSCCGSSGNSCCGSGWGGVFGDNGCCADRGRFWFSSEFLLSYDRAETVPPLVTSSPVGVPLFANGRAIAGAIGQPSTQVLYNSVPDQLRPGFRFDAGMWFSNYCPNLGVEVNYLTLGQVGNSSTFYSTGNPQLFRPFYNVAPANGVAPQNFTELVAVPGIVGGTVTVSSYSQVWGMEGLFRYKWCCGPNYWLDILAGYRHFDLTEGIDISENLTTSAATGSTNIIVHDSFHTRNQFNGGEVGLEGQWHFAPRWSLFGTVKVAMGDTHEILDINGSTTSGGVTLPGGLLALPTNIGRYTADRFAVQPEVGLKIAYDVTDRLTLYVGYDLIYLSNVIRPGDQIDTNVNPNFIPNPPFGAGTGVGPHQPAVLFHTTSFWTQGVNFGLIYRF